MRVLVVDDEPLARERLAQMVAKAEDAELAGTAGNGKQALEFVSEQSVDVVLLDIRMPVMDGIEAAQHMRQLDDGPAVVFCTAYDEHALAAFDANAIDYIVKPVRAERLERAMRKARRLTRDSAEAIKPSQRSHLCAAVRGALELVEIDDVLCLIAEHKYVTVVHRNGETIVEESLKALEAEFPDRFLRIHRNALVGIQHIAGLGKNDNGQAIIRLHRSQRELEISRRNLSAVRKALKQL